MKRETGTREQGTGNRDFNFLFPVSCSLFPVLFLLAGCPPKPPVVRPYPPPSASELAARLGAQQAAVRSMNARVKATSWLGGDRVRATVLMLVTREGSLRFEAEVALQGTVAVLVTDGGRFQLFDAQKNEIHRGPACPANVASLVRIPLEPREVAAILLGDVVVDPAAAAAGTVGWDAGRGADVLTVAVAAGTMQLFFQGDAAHRTLVAVSSQDAGGRRLWQTAYEDFGSDGGVTLPSLIRFAEGTQSFDDGVEVRFKDRTLNVTPKPADFTLSAPAGLTVREVGCGGVVSGVTVPAP
jgi:hypothetical protein